MVRNLYFFTALLGTNTTAMSLINKILAEIKNGASFSANHNGIIPYRHIETEPAYCPPDNEDWIKYVVQEWAKKSIYHNDSVISFLITEDQVKMYY